ncbi:MAG: DUF1998 domain-containing protein [Acidobacteriia bacterium]|nr:DUF1998 domain-containing protein [Terriglobia bacterium]
MSPAGSNRRQYKSRRVGGVRPSQMIHTYGPGAVMDLPQLSVVLAGIDRWDIDQTERVLEPRLIGAVRAVPGCHRVVEFRMPPWQEETASPFDEWARVGVPVHPFPRWLRCTQCDLLAPVDRRRFQLDVPVYRPDKARYFHDRCNNRRPSAVPARFLVACAAGHLDDFPWEQYVHRGNPCARGPLLELREAGKADRATDVRVVCKTCGTDRLVHDAFGPEANQHLPRCRGRHPHLQRFDGDCAQPTRALLLGASNAWFAVYRSALTIPTVTGEIEQKVAEHWDLLDDIEDRDELDFIVKRLVRGAGEKPLRWLLRYDADDVWTAIVDRRGGGAEDTGTGDLRGPEWEAFTAAVPPRSDDFEIRALDVPGGFKKTLDHPVAVDRLREVQALCGFTRIDGPDEADPNRIAPIWHAPQPWLPAAEVRGEGILIRLPESRVEQWERTYRDSRRCAHLQQATRNWRTRRGLDPDGGMPPARFVLLHTLSHLLMHQVALDCGYSTASIRERLYCRESGDAEGPPMAGLLLYTGSPDSEGTLGGLVALAEPARLAAVLRDALSRARLCSTDPMCADHHAGDLGDTLHNAACHACLFAPETSCEAGNRYLDRGAAVPILGHPDDAYFT